MTGAMTSNDTWELKEQNETGNDFNANLESLVFPSELRVSVCVLCVHLCVCVCVCMCTCIHFSFHLHSGRSII